MTTNMLNEVKINTNEVLTELQNTSAELIQLINPLNHAQINRVPLEGGWTAAQIIRHVNMSDKGLLEMLHGPVEQTLRQPDEKIKQIRSNFLDFTIKTTSPEFVLPANITYDKERLVHSFLQTRSQLSENFEHANLAETCSLFSFPVYGYLTKYELLNFVIGHTQRHIHQLKNNIQKFQL